MLLAIISDTHLPRGRRRLPARAVALLREAELILHAGDVTSEEFLSELSSYGRLAAVHGNVDENALQLRLPERMLLDLEGSRIGMIHDAGQRRGRLDRLRELFPHCDAVVFGHSHIPLHERAGDGFQIFNPGSPTDRRHQPTPTMGLARIQAGHAPEFELVELESGPE